MINNSPVNRPLIIICPGCEKPPCISACKEKSLEELPKSGIRILKPWKCESCQAYDCVKACSLNAINIDPNTKKPIFCTQCGICSKFCSHEVLAFIEVSN